MPDFPGLDPALLPVVQRESAGNPFVGYGGTDLSAAPLDATGFPLWKGNIGPAGISHAAGLLQIQPGTWRPVAQKLGITDFSPASQIAVGNELARTQGLAPWAASERPGRGLPGGDTGLPNFAGIAGRLGTSNQLAPVQATQAISSREQAQAAPLGISPLAMFSLLAAGTHKFVPVSYDPFAVEQAMVTPKLSGVIPGGNLALGTGVGESLASAAPRVTPATTPAAGLPYMARLGMRKAYEAATARGPTSAGTPQMGLDPTMQNLLAGVV